ncbi:MAG: sigma factor, partial [Acidimicrobiia bacterium]
MRNSDDELVDRARSGDRDAFCTLLERHRIVALRVGYTIAGDEAEDAVQEAMIKAFRHLDQFRPGAPFRPWLLTIVANEARNRRRADGRHRALALRLTT